MSTTRKPNISPSTISVPEVAATLDINLIAAYNLTRTPGFPALKVGKRILVPRTSFEAWLETAAHEQAEYGGKKS